MEYLETGKDRETCYCTPVQYAKIYRYKKAHIRICWILPRFMACSEVYHQTCCKEGCHHTRKSWNCIRILRVWNYVCSVRDAYWHVRPHNLILRILNWFSTLLCICSRVVRFVLKSTVCILFLYISCRIWKYAIFEACKTEDLLYMKVSKDCAFGPCQSRSYHYDADCVRLSRDYASAARRASLHPIVLSSRMTT